MDVAGPLVKCPLDEGVDEADRGRGVGVLAAARHLGGHDVAAVVAGRPLHLLDDARGALVAVQGGDGLLHGAAGGDHGYDLPAGRGLQLLLSHEVQRVTHRHVQLVLYQLHRHHAVLPGDGAGHILGQLHRNRHAGQVDIVHAQLHLQSIDELPLGDNAAVDEHVAQTLAALLLGLQGGLQLFLGDGAGGDQQIAQTHIGHVRSPFQRNN